MGYGGSQTARPCSQNLTLILLGPGRTIRHRLHKLGTNSHNITRVTGQLTSLNTALVTLHGLGHTSLFGSHYTAHVKLHGLATLHVLGHSYGSKSHSIPHHQPRSHKITWVTQLGSCTLHSPGQCELLESQHKAWIRPQFISVVLLFFNGIFKSEIKH